MGRNSRIEGIVGRGKITAAAYTGPAQAPRPASTTPPTSP
jgi:hypothetical protein